VKYKIKNRISHIKWLLFTKITPPALAAAQKLQAEFDFLETSFYQAATKNKTFFTETLPGTTPKRNARGNVPTDQIHQESYAMTGTGTA